MRSEEQSAIITTISRRFAESLRSPRTRTTTVARAVCSRERTIYIYIALKFKVCARGAAGLKINDLGGV